jgi:A/G-specific adenine glycosylase
MNIPRLRKQLLAWYGAYARDLPWRQTREPYAIWLSEVMLQQTRVVAVIPYYEKFLTLFPTVQALAAAPEQALLAAWAGLGYYSRARNLQRAARNICDLGGFPTTYEGIAALPGVGAYTAAAVASIAFDLPHAAVDGNVLRVIARLDAERGALGGAKTRQKLAARAQELLAVHDPAAWNQAMMELGATICLPRTPNCGACPVSVHCSAYELGIASQLPAKSKKPRKELMRYSVALITRQDEVLFVQRAGDAKRLQDFWELPRVEQVPGFRVQGSAGVIRHAITVNDFEIEVLLGSLGKAPVDAAWISKAQLSEIPITTVSRKALAAANLFTKK